MSSPLGFPSSPADSPARSRRAMRWLTSVIVLVVVGGAVAGWFRASDATEPPSAQPPSPADTSARAPAGTRVRVRVLNATTTRGLAKRATMVLREFGYDVVDFDNVKTKRSTTLVLAHSGHDAWAQRLRRAMGVGAIEATTDSLRFVDLTVLVGRDWKPPAQPFRP